MKRNAKGKKAINGKKNHTTDATDFSTPLFAMTVTISKKGCTVEPEDLIIDNKKLYSITWKTEDSMKNDKIGLTFPVNAAERKGHPFPELYVEFEKEVLLKFQFDHVMQPREEKHHTYQIYVNGEPPQNCPVKDLAGPRIIVKTGVVR